MADIAWSDVVALQANLDGVDPTAQTIILRFVNENLNPSAFGGEDSAQYTLARCFFAAHLGEIERRRGNQTGALQSKTIGTSSIALAYAAASSGDSEALMQTSWGSQFFLLLQMSPQRFVVNTCR